MERNGNVWQFYYEYQSVVWTNQKITIPSVIRVFATPIFCETIIHPKEKVIELIVMMIQNTGFRLTVGEQQEDLELETTQRHNIVLLLRSALSCCSKL
jgi:hypothetical protein